MGDQAFVCDMTHSHVTWLIYKEHNVFTGDVTHLYVTWRIQKRSCRRANGRQTRPVWHSHVAWLIQVCRDSFESRHTWMSHDSLWCMRHVTLEWVTALLNESWLNESWLIQVCRDSHTKCAVTHMTHSSVPWLIYEVCRDSHDSFKCAVNHLCVTWRIHQRPYPRRKTWPIWRTWFVCDITHWCVTWGWLRLVGSLKLHVSFAKEPYKETIFCKRDIYFEGAY